AEPEEERQPQQRHGDPEEGGVLAGRDRGAVHGLRRGAHQGALAVVRHRQVSGDPEADDGQHPRRNQEPCRRGRRRRLLGPALGRHLLRHRDPSETASPGEHTPYGTAGASRREPCAPGDIGCAGGNAPGPRARRQRPARIPSAISSASARTPASPDARSGASSMRRMNAEPTMTPSANPATSAAWAPLEMPSPSPTGRPEPPLSMIARVRSTRRGAPVSTAERVPVTPITDAAYTNPRHTPVIFSMRSSVELSATRNTRSRSWASDASSHAPPSSGVRSGVISPAPPAEARSRANASTP